MRLLHARELPEKPKNADCWAPFPRRGCSRPSVGPGDLHASPACRATLAPGPSRISGLSAQWKVHVLTAAAPLARPEPQQLPGPPRAWLPSQTLCSSELLIFRSSLMESNACNTAALSGGDTHTFLTRFPRNLMKG